jgi:O-antigen/teichoic acid export membrane protein
MTDVATPRKARLGLRRALVLSAGGAAGARAIGAVGGLLAARLLGPTGRGQLAVLVVLGTAGATAASAGIHFWIAREVARHGRGGHLARIVAVHAVVVVVCVPIVGLLLAPAITALTGVGTAAVTACVMLAIAGALAFVVLAIPHGLRAMGVVGIATVLGAATYACITALLLATETKSVTLVVLGAVAGQVVVGVVAIAYGRRTLREGGIVDEAPPAYREALAFSIPAGAGELVLLAMLRVDVVLVAAFLPVASAGLYAVAIALSEVLWVIPDGIALVVLPTSSAAPSATRSRRLVMLTISITVVCGAALSVVAEPLITMLFGDAFRGAAAAVPLLAVAAVAGGAWKVVGAEIVAAGRTAPRLWSAASGLVAMVIVDIAAIPTLKIRGAALGSALGYGLAVLVLRRWWPWTRRASRPAMGQA